MIYNVQNVTESVIPLVTNISDDITCYYVHNFESVAEKCDFVRHNGTCNYEGVFYSYTQLSYCELGNVFPVAIVVLIAILLLLFFAIGQVADEFFCPSLMVIAKTFRMPDHIAGITLLAFGNGAPDIFSSISGINQAKPFLVFASLYGSGVFLTTIVAGVIIVVSEKQFFIQKRPIIRDILFYIGASVLIWIFIYNGVLKLVHSLILIGFYILYIITVIVSRYLYVRMNKSKVAGEDCKEDFAKSTNSLDSKLAIVEAGDSEQSSIQTVELSDSKENNNFQNEFNEFLYKICPVNLDDWSEQKWYGKMLNLFAAIPNFVLTICIPVVDLEKEKENWNRLLLCTNIIFAPQVLLFLFQLNQSINGVFPLWALFLMISLVVVLVLYFTTKPNNPPIYHRIVFGLSGFGMSTIVTNAVAQELVSVLTTLGIIFNFSESILGLTILAWGNSLPDLITSYSIARDGYPGMAFSSCFGGTIFNLLLGVGLPYSILFIGGSESIVNIQYSSMITLLFVSILVSICTSLGFFLFYRFKSSKVNAIILFIIYALYLILALLIEFNVI